MVSAWGHRGWGARLRRWTSVAVLVGVACAARAKGRAAQPSEGEASTRKEIAQWLADNEALASARVVGFGETSHGTREFRETVFDAAMAFAGEGGEVTIALERGPIDAANVNEAIGGCGSIGMKEDMPKNFFREMDLAWIDALYEHNRRSKGCIRVRRIPAPRRPSLQRDLVRDFDSPVLLSAADACEGRDCDTLREHVYCLPRGWKDPRVAYTKLDARHGFDWFLFFPHAHAERPFVSTR